MVGIAMSMSVVVAALLGGPIGMSGYLIAIDNIGPGLTAIISTFYPALGTLLAFILLKERMAPRQIAALLVALAAIVATGWSATSEPIEGGNAILGVVGALACVIGWGSEAVILTWGMRDEAVDMLGKINEEIPAGVTPEEFQTIFREAMAEILSHTSCNGIAFNKRVGSLVSILSG